MLEETVREFKLPAWLDAPWLTEQYVRENAFYPVCCEELLRTPIPLRFKETQFGNIPIKHRDEFRPGDIIIFNEYNSWTENGEYATDRFLRIHEEDIEDYLDEKRSMLPVGVVVHSPENKFTDEDCYPEYY